MPDALPANAAIPLNTRLAMQLFQDRLPLYSPLCLAIILLSTTIADSAYIGMTRDFTSFRQAAAEASISCLYGGIHYRASLDTSLIHGANGWNCLVLNHRDELRCRRCNETCNACQRIWLN